MKEWFVYLILCANDSLYCGIAKDPLARFDKHQAGKGARYTRMHKALELVYQKGPFTHGDALRREREIKALSRLQKTQLLTSSSSFPASLGPA